MIGSISKSIIGGQQFIFQPNQMFGNIIFMPLKDELEKLGLNLNLFGTPECSVSWPFKEDWIAFLDEFLFSIPHVTTNEDFLTHKAGTLNGQPWFIDMLLVEEKAEAATGRKTYCVGGPEIDRFSEWLI